MDVAAVGAEAAAQDGEPTTVGPVDVRIVGVNLPGRTCGGYENIHVGVQRRAEVLGLFPGDAPEAVWDFEIERHPSEDDLRGPHVQGRRGERFVYLSWGTVDPTGTFEMFRRAKLMLNSVDAHVLDAAGRPGHRLQASVGLTGGDGGPLCAAVRPPTVSWTAPATG